MTATPARTDLFRVSALGTAVFRMWRAWRIVLPVVFLNAAAQGVLVALGVLPYLSPGFVVVALLSYAVLVVAFALVAAAMLQAAEGEVDGREVLGVLRGRWLPLLAWTSGWVVVVTVGLAAYVVPGLVVLAITPYLLLAVLDGSRNPVSQNFRVIAARWGRWLVTVMLVAVVCGVLWLLAALDGFFVAGAPGAVIGWLVLGLISSWLIAAWALVYRSVKPASQRRS